MPLLQKHLTELKGKVSFLKEEVMHSVRLEGEVRGLSTAVAALRDESLADGDKIVDLLSVHTEQITALTEAVAALQIAEARILDSEVIKLDLDEDTNFEVTE
jgi:hypothetical protein